MPIVSMLLVPSRDDPWLVGGHSLLVGNSLRVERRHHPRTVAGRLT
jgi:hypothetical protein